VSGEYTRRGEQAVWWEEEEEILQAGRAVQAGGEGRFTARRRRSPQRQTHPRVRLARGSLRPAGEGFRGLRSKQTLWLAEVFGGPAEYSEHHGGYAHMVAKHIGLSLTEPQRARWVQLIGLAADDAGLPSDPEFRSAFIAYIEWGTRLALEVALRDRRIQPRAVKCRAGHRLFSSQTQDARWRAHALAVAAARSSTSPRARGPRDVRHRCARLARLVTSAVSSERLRTSSFA